MKTRISLSLLVSLTVSSFLHAQTPVFTEPMGYTTQALPSSTTNDIGINILKPMVVAGTLTGVSGAILTDSTKDFSTLLTAGKTYIIEIVSGTNTTPPTAGTAAGAVDWFTDWAGSDFTVSSTITIAGVAVGDRYTIRLAPTLQELFPTGTLTTFGLANVTNADKVWVPQGDGNYLKYAIKTGANAGWHLTDGSVSLGLITVDIPVLTTDGLLVEKKATTSSLVIDGQVKTTSTNVYVISGSNLISINPPVGSTLFNCGLTSTDLTTFGLANVTNADKVWVPQGNGTYLKYAIKTGTNAGWHLTDGSVSLGLITVDFALPPAILIQRISITPKIMTFDVPSGYSGL